MNNRGVVRNVRTPAKAAVGQRFVCMSGAEDSKDEEEDAPKEPSMPIAKASEFRGMSREDMLEEIAKCKNALFDLRMKQSTRQEVKNDQFKKLRKKVRVLACSRSLYGASCSAAACTRRYVLRPGWG